MSGLVEALIEVFVDVAVIGATDRKNNLGCSLIILGIIGILLVSLYFINK